MNWNRVWRQNNEIKHVPGILYYFCGAKIFSLRPKFFVDLAEKLGWKLATLVRDAENLGIVSMKCIPKKSLRIIH
jgi:hypothetical protein